MPDPTLSILLVEDADLEAEVAKRVLDRCDFSSTMTRVADGDQALSHLRSVAKGGDGSLPSVVFLDLNLPTISGHEVLRTIRSDPKLSHLPVIMLSTSDDPDDILESYRANANSYITKPLGFEPLKVVFNKVGDYLLNVVQLPN